MALFTEISHLGKSDIILTYDDSTKELLKISAINRSKTQKIKLIIRSPISWNEIVSKEHIFNDNLPEKLKYIPKERELEGGEKVTDYTGILWHATLGN